MQQLQQHKLPSSVQAGSVLCDNSAGGCDSETGAPDSKTGLSRVMAELRLTLSGHVGHVTDQRLHHVPAGTHRVSVSRSARSDHKGRCNDSLLQCMLALRAAMWRDNQETVTGMKEPTQFLFCRCCCRLSVTCTSSSYMSLRTLLLGAQAAA